MCVQAPKIKPVQVAAYDGAEANSQADIETRIRQRRRGAAGNILTGAFGIPGSPTMGGAV